MDQRLPIFMEEVPDYEVRDGHMHIIWRELEIVLPVCVMLAGIAGARQAIERWQQSHQGQIVRFPEPTG